MIAVSSTCYQSIYPRHVTVHRFRVCWSQATRVVGGMASSALQHRLEEGEKIGLTIDNFKK